MVIPRSGKSGNGFAAERQGPRAALGKQAADARLLW